MNRKVPHHNVTKRLLDKLSKMSKEESLQTFVDAGIFDQNGQLTEAYKPMSNLNTVGDEREILDKTSNKKILVVINEYDPSLCGLSCYHLNDIKGYCKYFEKDLAKHGIEWVRCLDCYQ